MLATLKIMVEGVFFINDIHHLLDGTIEDSFEIGKMVWSERDGESEASFSGAGVGNH